MLLQAINPKSPVNIVPMDEGLNHGTMESILQDKMLNPRVTPQPQGEDVKCNTELQSLMRNCTNNPDPLCRDYGKYFVDV